MYRGRERKVGNPQHCSECGISSTLAGSAINLTCSAQPTPSDLHGV